MLGRSKLKRSAGITDLTITIDKDHAEIKIQEQRQEPTPQSAISHNQGGSFFSRRVRIEEDTEASTNCCCPWFKK